MFAHTLEQKLLISDEINGIVDFFLSPQPLEIYFNYLWVKMKQYPGFASKYFKKEEVYGKID